MRCRDARQWLNAQRDGDLVQSDGLEQEHLKLCPGCRLFERRQQHIHSLMHASAPCSSVRVSTEAIMLAIQQQVRITQQLEELQAQQRTRIERTRSAWAAMAAISFFTLGSIPLLLLAATITQTDLVVKALSLLSTAVDVLVVLAQYALLGLSMVTRNNWLLSGIAFAVVIMMAMWLRLMRYPQEA
jgi:hypothetical protein